MRYADWFRAAPRVSVRRLRDELERCRQMDIERQRTGEQDAYLAQQARGPREDWRERAFRRATGNR
jgi:hypothetical protein